jgi:hypothetical protein
MAQKEKKSQNLIPGFFATPLTIEQWVYMLQHEQNN